MPVNPLPHVLQTSRFRRLRKANKPVYRTRGGVLTRGRRQSFSLFPGLHPPRHRTRTTCARIPLQRSIFHMFSSRTGRSFALPCGSFTQLMIVAPLFRAVPLLTVEMPVGVAQIASMASLSHSLSPFRSLCLSLCISLSLSLLLR